MLTIQNPTLVGLCEVAFRAWLSVCFIMISTGCTGVDEMYRTEAARYLRIKYDSYIKKNGEDILISDGTSFIGNPGDLRELDTPILQKYKPRSRCYVADLTYLDFGPKEKKCLVYVEKQDGEFDIRTCIAPEFGNDVPCRFLKIYHITLEEDEEREAVIRELGNLFTSVLYKGSIGIIEMSDEYCTAEILRYLRSKIMLAVWFEGKRITYITFE